MSKLLNQAVVSRLRLRCPFRCPVTFFVFSPILPKRSRDVRGFGSTLPLPSPIRASLPSPIHNVFVILVICLGFRASDFEFQITRFRFTGLPWIKFFQIYQSPAFSIFTLHSFQPGELVSPSWVSSIKFMTSLL